MNKKSSEQVPRENAKDLDCVKRKLLGKLTLGCTGTKNMEKDKIALGKTVEHNYRYCQIRKRSSSFSREVEIEEKLTVYSVLILVYFSQWYGIKIC